MSMSSHILASLNDGIAAIEQLKEPHALAFIESVATLLATTFRKGNKVLIAGNGGSLCDAAHFAEELTGQFRKHRAALPAIALADPGHLTCVANDMGYEHVFSRSIEALGKVGDVFIGLTTSGNSKNLIHAFEVAHQSGLATVAFLGKGGGRLKGFADHELIINGFAFSDRVQEAHMAALHILVELVEYHLFHIGKA